MIALILICFLVVAAWAISLKRWPFRPCGRCGGRGTNRGSTRRRYGACPRCQGTKQVRRFGATAVHRWWGSVRGTGWRDRRKKRIRDARERAGHPE